MLRSIRKQVEITIPVKSNSKTVPIKIVRNGTPPEGVTIESIEIDEKEATISGDDNVLNKYGKCSG